MEHYKMIVTMEDGCQVTFLKENGNIKCITFNGLMFNENEVREESIRAVVGKPLTFTYYYGCGSSEKLETGAPVEEINYE